MHCDMLKLQDGLTIVEKLNCRDALYSFTEFDHYSPTYRWYMPYQTFGQKPT